MTDSTILMTIGWVFFLAAWVTGHFISKKEETKENKLHAKYSEKLIAKDYETMETYYHELRDLRNERLGLFGSHGVRLQLLIFGFAFFISNFIIYIF